MIDSNLEPYLTPAPGIQSEHPKVIDLARSIAQGSTNELEIAGRLFDYVRDTVRYSPYMPFAHISDYHALTVLERGRGYCVQKSALLATLARALGIACRLGFADIQNHQLPAGLFAVLGSDVMHHHCFTEWYLAGSWRKVTPSFEEPLCAQRGWRLVEFNPDGHSLLAETDVQGRPHISYLRYLGNSPGVPLAEILDSWRDSYGPERVRAWEQAIASGDTWIQEAAS